MNFGELKTLLELYLHRDDLASSYTGIFELVRQRLSADARLLVMETTHDFTPEDGSAPLPLDFIEARVLLQSQTRGQQALQYREPAAFADLGRQNVNSLSYTIDGGRILTGRSAACELRYYQRPAQLVNDEDKNGILTNWPSLYLQCALMYCQQIAQDTESQEVAATMYGTELEKANDADEKARRSGDSPSMVAM